MGTQSRELRGHSSDGKTMVRTAACAWRSRAAWLTSSSSRTQSAVSAKAVVATKQPGVDLRVWCRNWGALEAERGESE